MLQKVPKRKRKEDNLFYYRIVSISNWTENVTYIISFTCIKYECP